MPMLSDRDLFEALCDAEDIDPDDIDTLMRMSLDSVAPGICRDPDCGAVTEGHEPDARANWCPCCEGQTVIALPELALGIF